MLDWTDDEGDMLRDAEVRLQTGLQGGMGGCTGRGEKRRACGMPWHWSTEDIGGRRDSSLRCSQDFEVILITPGGHLSDLSIVRKAKNSGEGKAPCNSKPFE